MRSLKHATHTPHLAVAKYLPLGENWICRTSAPCGDSSCANLSALSSSITLETLSFAPLNARSPGSGTGLIDVSGPAGVEVCHHKFRTGKPGGTGVVCWRVVRCNFITAWTAFWKRRRGSRTSRRRWVSCLCSWLSNEPGASFEMDGTHAVLLTPTSSSAVGVAPFLALTLGGRMALNRVRKRVSDARVAARRRRHHCIASQCGRFAVFVQSRLCSVLYLVSPILYRCVVVA